MTKPSTMAVWTGFSDAEIRQMRENLSPDNGSSRPKSKTAFTSKTPSRSKPQKSPAVSKTPDSSNDQTAISDEMKLSKSRTSPDSCSNEFEEVEDVEGRGNDIVEEKSYEDLKVLNEKEVMSLETSSIEAFQKKQREIEDMNKKKKQLLIDAIAERRRQASRESKNLEEIQVELGKLDSLLSGDVCMLRDRIETASREYMDAQKRYERAEQEFVAAKLDLHCKAEIKQGLTEHLHIIIHKNELRRSKKLAELMSKLDMESSPDVDDVTLSCTHDFMTSVQTLGPHGPVNPKKILLDSVGIEKTDYEYSNSKRVQNDVITSQNDIVTSENDLQKLNDDVTNCDESKPTSSGVVENDLKCKKESDDNLSVDCHGGYSRPISVSDASQITDFTPNEKSSVYPSMNANIDA